MPTMKDVARVAGVSQAAVSYAYSRPSKISVALVDHIMRTAADLGYAGPSSMGASLRSGKTGAVGLMVTDTLAYAFADPSTRLLLESIVRSERLDGLNLTLIPLPVEPADAGLTARGGLRGLVDGVIVHCLPDGHPGLLALQSRGIPIVVVDAPHLPGAPRVSIDDRGAAREQARHLLDLGHRRIGVLTDRLSPDGHRGPVTPERRASSEERVVRERLAGYAEVFDTAGVPFDDAPIHEAGGFDEASGRWATRALLDEHDVTALLCTSDTMALAALEEMESRGLRAPADVSVIGFDDAPASAARGLTTIRQPLRRKGELAADMLGRLLAGETDVPCVEFSTDLLVRATTGPPA